MVKDFTGELLKAGCTRGDISVYHLMMTGKSSEQISRILLLTQKTVDTSIEKVNELLLKVNQGLTKKTNDIISKQETTIAPIKGVNYKRKIVDESLDE